MSRPVPEPRIDRDITVQMMGDWGIANLHRINGWLMAEMGARSGPGSRFACWAGKGGTDAFGAVLSGAVDTSFFVPAGFARTVIEGKGIYSHPDIGRLRAIGTFPQDDRLVIAIDARHGVRTLAQLRQKRPALTIALAFDDGENMAGFAANRLLEAAGIPRAVLEGWGCIFVEGEAPWDTIPLVTEGPADTVIFEAVMTPYWKDLQASRDMAFIPIDDAALTSLERDYSWARGPVPADRFEGLEKPFETLDFSDFLLMCRDDLNDEIAYLMAWCGCETTATIERQYSHIPPKDSPLTYPLDPAKISQTSIPLHPGAARYYRDAGLLNDAAQDRLKGEIE